MIDDQAMEVSPMTLAMQKRNELQYKKMRPTLKIAKGEDEPAYQALANVAEENPDIVGEKTLFIGKFSEAISSDKKNPSQSNKHALGRLTLAKERILSSLKLTQGAVGEDLRNIEALCQAMAASGCEADLNLLGKNNKINQIIFISFLNLSGEFLKSILDLELEDLKPLEEYLVTVKKYIGFRNDLKETEVKMLALRQANAFLRAEKQVDRYKEPEDHFASPF